MDTIHILQKTYEDLYLARIPLLNFLQERLPVISSQWKKDCIERVLEKDTDLTFKQKEKQNEHRKDFSQLDIYFLIQILIDNQNWNNLIALFPDDLYTLSQDNKELFYRIKNIRCTVMHPTFEEYGYDDFINWENDINAFVNIFSPDKTLKEYRIEFHKTEKEKLLSLILNEVINPALSSETLDSEIKMNIKNTKERLENQISAEGIIAFFYDALDSLQGKKIAEVLRNNNLKSFEIIKDDLLRNYE